MLDSSLGPFAVAVVSELLTRRDLALASTQRAPPVRLTPRALAALTSALPDVCGRCRNETHTAASLFKKVELLCTRFSFRQPAHNGTRQQAENHPQ